MSEPRERPTGAAAWRETPIQDAASVAGGKLTRRAFEGLALVLVPVAYGVSLLLGMGRFLAPLPPPRRKSRLEVGRASDFDGGKVQRVDFNNRAIYVLKEKEELLALDAACTHFSCNVNWKDREQCFVCPCHGARFDRTGKAIRAPGVGYLRRQKFIEDGGKVMLLDEPGAGGS